jgi:hypothetical protein
MYRCLLPKQVGKLGTNTTMRSSLLPRSASAFCTCSILYFVSAGLAAGEGGGRSPGQEQHLKNGVIEKLNNAKGDLIEISKHVRAT